MPPLGTIPSGHRPNGILTPFKKDPIHATMQLFDALISSRVLNIANSSFQDVFKRYDERADFLGLPDTEGSVQV